MRKVREEKLPGRFSSYKVLREEYPPADFALSGKLRGDLFFHQTFQDGF
ncbi:hypothetical protein [Calothrix sp. NIES-3974]|nr:hypothetical protein [Calothrix sp. NIES-3974]